MAVNINIQAKQTNVWKWVGMGCGGTLLLGIAAIAGFSFWAYSTVKNMADPKTAVKTASEILEYQLPGTPEGFMGLDLMGVKLAGVTGYNKDGELSLLGMAKIPGDTSRRSRQKLETSLQQGIGEQFTSTDVRRASMQLCGQVVNVEVLSGTFKADAGEQPAVMYHTNIKHKNNLILVSLMSTGVNPEATNDKVFGTLKCK
jgi:hypothetical protein